MTSMTTVTATRRPKWQYQQLQPTPRILHLPRRPRRRTAKSQSTKPISNLHQKGKLETLFDQERLFSWENPPIVLVDYGGEREADQKRERVKVEEIGNESGGLSVVQEEKWRFQAEMLRAECNLLRMEREIAIRKMERTKVQMDRALRSAVKTLSSGRNKICEGKNAKMVIEELILNLAKKHEKLQRRLGAKDHEVHNSSNFDKQASSLKKRLEKFGETSDKICVKEITEIAEASLLSITTSSRVNEGFSSNEKSIVEILRRKMEGLSNGTLLDRMKEECGSMLSTASSSVASSSASSSKRIEFFDCSSLKQRHYQDLSYEEKLCSGRCKEIIRRIIEQVRAETEQWSQMQEMLGQVRWEMEQLQASRDSLEDQLLHSDNEIQSLQSTVQEWKQKAMYFESQADEAQAEISVLRVQLDRLREDQKKQLVRAKGSPPKVAQNETEKRVLVCRLKENHHTPDMRIRQKEYSIPNDDRKKSQAHANGRVPSRRPPFQNIGNSSLLPR